jgi:hypothetical protein
VVLSVDERTEKMNENTREIAAWLNVSLEQALKIQNFIDDNALIDWSEDSNAKIQRVAKKIVKSDFAVALEIA